MATGRDLKKAMDQMGEDDNRTLGQVMSLLIQVLNTSPNEIEKIAQIARHVAQVHAIADTAINSLTKVSKRVPELREHQTFPHNVQMLAEDFARLSDHSVSHGGDI